MLFSTFCWHYEDNLLCSISYNHVGCSRTWYGIPGLERHDMERIARKFILPKHVCRNEDHLRKQTSMFSPDLLVQHGLSVCRTIQRPGDFIITWPGAFHSGFSHGCSVSESVNFALADWLPWGFAAIRMYTKVGRKPVLQHADLILNYVDNALQRLENCSDVHSDDFFFQAALRFLIQEERAARQDLITFASRVECLDKKELVDSCSICNFSLDLSFFTCHCKPKQRLCWLHLQDHRGAVKRNPCRVSLFIRYTIDELQDRFERLSVQVGSHRFHCDPYLL